MDVNKLFSRISNECATVEGLQVIDFTAIVGIMTVCLCCRANSAAPTLLANKQPATARTTVVQV